MGRRRAGHTVPPVTPNGADQNLHKLMAGRRDFLMKEAGLMAGRRDLLMKGAGAKMKPLTV